MSLNSIFKSIYICLVIVFFTAINSYGYLSETTRGTNHIIYADDIKLLTPAGPFCVTDAPVNLNASTPGGTWSGNGITDPVLGTFDPSVAGAGDHTITYTSVSGTENMVIHVDAAVNATITGVGPFCDNDNVVYLTAVSPGGTWSGTGILNPLTGEFDPETAGFGTHIIQYDVTNGACNDSDTESIETFESPDATYPPIPDVCETDSPFDIIPNTSGGTWSGTGITDLNNGTFDPATAGPGSHMITYSISNANCISTQVRRINVDTLVIATITPAGPFCDNEAELNLSAFHTGGTWSGTGITDISTGAFDPSLAGIGTHTITYEIISGACEDIDNTNIEVIATPNPTITDPGEFCSDDPAIVLTAAELGGTWAGPGITDPANGTFDPSAANDGANNITYTITNAGCTVIGSITIYVYDAAVDATIISSGPFCIADGLITLNAVSPGGTWSGTGIVDPANGIFDTDIAGVGSHIITYEVGNPACFDSDTETFQVDDSLSAIITPVGPVCETDAPFDFSAAITGGVWSGTGITDTNNGTFNPATAGGGIHTITYTISQGACTNTDNFDITVDAIVDATITPAGPFCQNEAPTNLNAVSAGGTWSGTGITDAVNGVFDPATAGPGNHTITYLVANGTCSDSDTEQITVDLYPDSDWTNIGPFCETDFTVNIVPNNPGGTFSGIGITNPATGTFNPQIAGDGTHSISYTIINGSCTSITTKPVVVDQSVDATINPAGPFCETDLPVDLSAADVGGTWSGTGITDPANGTFNPTVANPGTHTITYLIVNGACSDIDTENISVDVFPDSDWTNIGPFCEYEPTENIVPINPGGTFSGNGITDQLNGTFDPTIAGQGTHQISYTLVNGVCSSVTTKPVIVYEGVNPTITPAGPFCDNINALLLSASQSGGIWSGTGIINTSLGAFDPGVAGPGIHEIIYEISNTNCTNSDTTHITVFSSPDASFAPVYNICETDPAFDLVPNTPDGTWSGVGITDVNIGTFDPSVAGAGSHMITYTISNINCTSSAVRRLDVDPLVDASITPAGPFCEDEAEVILNSVDLGGTWSGTGITNSSTGTFNPAIAGIGLHTITYGLAVGACEDTATINIQVDSIPDATLAPAGPFCENDPTLDLTATTTGGIWSGTGIIDPNNGTFDPSVSGTGDFLITYDLTNGACFSQGNTNIHVDIGVDATITPVAPVCESDAAFNFVAADPGGIWSGTGITNAVNGTFDPALAGPGLHVIDYNITNGTCSDSDSQTIEVSTEPDATIAPAGPFCSNDPTTNLIPNTFGGTWAGIGIIDPVNGTFDPSVAGSGDFVITYDLINGACSEQGTINIHVDNEVDATITTTGPVCESDAAFNFSAIDGGGIWSGNGITNASNGTFDPTVAGVGFHTIDYNITNGVCSDSDSYIIEVSSAPDASVNAAGPFCESDAPINLTSTTPGGVWSGTGITDAVNGTFDPSVSGGGDFTISYDIINGGCSEQGTISIHVDDEVDATIAPPGPFCLYDTPVNLSAVSSGGIWSGSGITDINLGTFNPTVAGVGTFTVTYNVINGLCSDSDNIDIDVLLAPDGTIDDPGEFCSDDPPVNLTAATPGGVWSGTGITNAILGTFDPSLANDGLNNILYTVSNADCTTIGSITIYVYDAAVDATITSTGPYCISEGLITLTAVSSGGIWSGNGIIDPINGIFDPNIAGIGSHAITYDVGNPACFDTYTQMIQVDDSLSAIITPVATLCENSAPFNFSAANAGGTWSGTGITDPFLGTFNPTTAGGGTHIITYTISSGACTNIDTFDMIVDANVDATISAAGPFCENQTIQTLIAADAGGTWSGTGIFNSITGQFHPSLAGPGDHVIHYDIVNGTCSDSDTETIHIDALPNTTITATEPYCEDEPALNLVAATGGGTWSGTGITDEILGTFNPSSAGGGNHVITYELTLGACTNSSNTNIQVDDFYDATITPVGPFCNNGSAVTLTAATPGGTWSGTGITNPSNGTFHPGVSGNGDFVIQYQTTNGTCSDSDNITIHVDEYQNTTITPAGPFCENSASVNLTAAATGGTWTGTGITDPIIGTFSPTTAGNGSHTINYEIVNGACFSSSNITIQVDEFYDATITPAGPFCNNGSAITLTAATTGGTWSGTGITNPSNGTFHPGIAGPGDFVINYQITNGLCSDSDNIILHVDEYFDASILAVSDFCETNAPVDLLALNSGGTWSGNGIIVPANGTFDPSDAGAGDHLITYEISTGVCYSSDTETIHVDAQPNPTITPAGPLCANEPSFDLTAAQTGGQWSGVGITNTTNGTFNAAVAGAGDHVVTYEIINGVCYANDTEIIHIDSNPNTALSTVGPFCETDAVIDLIEPSSGGTWSGNGITNITTGIFDPGFATEGNHLITYTNINGACISSGTTNITVDALVDATITDVGPFCETDASIVLSAISSGGNWSGSGIVNPVTGVFNPLNAGVGNHTITYSVANGACSDIDDTQIIVDDSPEVNILTTGPFCENEVNQLFVADVTGGVWSGNGIDMTGSFSPSTAGVGIHPISYTLTTGTCVVVETVNITVDQFVDAQITSTGPFCFNDTPEYLTSLNPEGVWLGDGISLDGLFSPAGAGVGTHTITYEITNGACFDNDTQDILVKNNPDPTISGPWDVCENEPPFNYTAATSGGLWSGSGFTDIVAGTFSPQLSGVGGFLIVYQVTVDGCSSIDFDTLNVHELPVVTLSGLNSDYCINDEAVLVNVSPSGGVLSGGNIVGTLFDPEIAGVGTHLIEYEYTDTNSCSNTASFEVEVHDIPNVSISGIDATYCIYEDTVYPTLLPIGGTFEGSGTFNNVGFVPALAGPGDFELIYHFTDNFGCSDTSYFNTTVFDYANIEFESTQTLCFGDSTGSAIATVTGDDPFNYLWNDYASSITNEITNVSSGWYYLSVTDNNLCLTVDSVFVDQPPQLIADIVSSINASCHGFEDASVLATASGGTPDYEFEWNDLHSSDTSYIDSLPVGTYIITVTDANMCTATDTAFIIEPDTLSVNFIDIFNVSCYGNSDGSVTVEPQGGTEPYTALWNDNDSTIGYTVNNLEAGYYTVTIIDENDCQISDSVLITQPDSLYIEIAINPVICNQQTGSIGISAFGGTEPYEYLWSTSDTLPVIFNVISQDYHVTIQDANGCMIDTTIFVPSEGSLTAIITQTEYNLCFGDKTAELIAHTTLAAMPVYYNWSNYVVDSVNPNLPAGEYSVVITDSWGCVGGDSITVTEPELLVAEVNSIDILCKGEHTGVANVEISGGTPGYNIEWHNDETGYTVGNLGPGEVSVIVTDANSCRATGSSFISEPETGMVVNFNIKHVTCNGAQDGAINAFATGGNPPYWYTWFINDVEINEPSIRNLDGGYYTLQVSDNFGCITDTMIEILEVNTLIAEVEVGATSCIGNHDGYIAVFAGGGTPPYSYYLMDIMWESYIIDSLYRGDYYITVRDSNNCELNLGPIYVPDTEIDCLKIPAAFSPNGDGHNDEFYIENIHLYPRSMVQIYNRWGQLLYEDRGINGFWDGTYNGNPVPTGAYLYHIMLNIDEDPRVGTVTVIR